MMSYIALAAGGVGMIGIVLALWWRYKLAKSEGALAVSRLERATLITKNLKLEEKYLNQGKRHVEEVKRKGDELDVHIKRVQALTELLRTCSDPAVVAERLRGLFPAVSNIEAEGGHEGSGQGGASGVSQR